MTTRQRSMPQGTKTSQEWIAVGDLDVDPTYQRPLGEAKVKKMMRDFDPDLIGVLLVSRRDDNTNVVLDGQQRREAVVRMWGVNQKVPCLVYHGLSTREEAEIFVGFNETQTKPRALDRFRAKVVAADPMCVDIQRIAERHGLQVGPGTRPRGVQCVGTLENIYRKGGAAVLEEAITLVVDAGHVEAEPLPGEMVEAVASLLARYGKVLERDRLGRTLEESVPRRLLTVARAQRADVYMNRTSVSIVISKLLLDRYNQGRRSGRVVWVEVPSTTAAWKPVVE